MNYVTSSKLDIVVYKKQKENWLDILNEKYVKRLH